MQEVITEQLEKRAVNMAIQRPGYRIYERSTETPDGVFRAGVYFHGTRITQRGEGASVDTWICSPLYVEALTSEKGQNYGKLLRFLNPEGQWQQLAIPLRLFSGNGEEVRAELLDRGVEICPGNHRQLAAYILSQRPARHLVSTSKTGWHSEEVFVLPRRTLGRGDGVVFQSLGAPGVDYSAGGTLAEWTRIIGAACRDNPTATFAVASALAGSLLEPLGKQGGGFHFLGDSSCGKTTLMLLAASVWGRADDFIGTWRATGNGLEGAAVSRNDTCMILDEISESNSREVGAIVYAISNGHGKLRANRSGMAREPQQWRLLMLSSGERSLASHMAESGAMVKAGQEVRLPDVPVARSHGVFDALHGCADGAELSDRLKRAANEHYGHVGPLFVAHLIESGDRAGLRIAHEALQGNFKAVGGQEKRTADRFAVAALAGELAIGYGLLPLAPGAALAAARTMFRAWQDHRGPGDSEQRQILGAVADFVSRHGDARFSPLIGEPAHPVRDRAGWWKDDGDDRVYLFTNEGLRDATRGYDFKRVKRALQDAGWISERDAGRPTKNVRVNVGQQRLFHIKVGAGDD